MRLLNRGARKPSAAEVAANPRSESARLRAVEAVAGSWRGPYAEHGRTGGQDKSRAACEPGRGGTRAPPVPGGGGAVRTGTEPASSTSPSESRRHLRLVDREARRRTNRRHLIVSAAIAGIAVVFLALVALHVLIAENQFRLDQLQQQASVQQERYEKLRLEVAELEAPARIVSVAEGPLGMRQPGSVTYLPAPRTSAVGAARCRRAQDGDGAPGPVPHYRPARRRLPAHGSGRPAPAGGSVRHCRRAPQGDADWPLIKQYLSGSP